MKALILVALVIGSCYPISVLRPPPPPGPPDNCWEDLQKDYRGDVKTTISNFTCQSWTSQSPHQHSRTEENYPESGLGDHNYCRNPDNELGGAWCYTTNPDQRWDYCPVPKCSPGEHNCWNCLQKDYRGPVQITQGGVKCQKWTEQYPHEHSRTEENYPESGLGDNNYCRNPDNELGGAWCYTTNPDKRWDYCPVPKCSSGETKAGCWDCLQKDYRGDIKTTISNFTCQSWTSQSPQEHSRTEENYPESGLGDHNYCRNPDNELGGAWCYTTNPDQRWDYCPVPNCGSGPSSGEHNCWNCLQKDYRGPIQTTKAGEKCQKWTEQYPHEHSRTAANYPESGLGDHNYCRNPDNALGGAWCYTTNPDKRWDYCPVPKCSSGEPKAGCSDCLQKDYRGRIDVTLSKQKCQNWIKQEPHQHSRTEENYPESGLGDHNYCRNPDNELGGAWCYTTNPDQRWDYCPVPKCSSGPSSGEHNCWNGLQKEYRGPIQITQDGDKCQKWTEQYPHKHSRTEENYPESGLGDHNYCRNPDNELGGAWCYTTNPKKRWALCPVPKCTYDFKAMY